MYHNYLWSNHDQLILYQDFLFLVSFPTLIIQQQCNMFNEYQICGYKKTHNKSVCILYIIYI